jgi:hypothetical protein
VVDQLGVRKAQLGDGGQCIEPNRHPRGGFLCLRQSKSLVGYRRGNASDFSSVSIPMRSRGALWTFESLDRRGRDAGALVFECRFAGAAANSVEQNVSDL